VPLTLEERLTKIQATFHGKRVSIKEMLSRLSNKELQLIFSDVLEDLMQEGRIADPVVAALVREHRRKAQ
jgi:hypothetical protein